MKLAMIRTDRGDALGLVVDQDRVVNLNLVDPELPSDMLALIQGDESHLVRVNELAAQWSAGQIGPDSVLPMSSLRLGAPISRPPSIIALGRNFRDKLAEAGVERHRQPDLLPKLPSSVIGPRDPIIWDPRIATEVDFGVELAVVIGRRARHVPRSAAYDVVFGYTCSNDLTSRGLMREDHPRLTRAKSLDTFCPIGPVLVTKDEIPDPHNLGLVCHVNGRTMQDSNTSFMDLDIPTVIASITRDITLYPGDLILTGAPAGMGGWHNPPVFLNDGDLLESEIELIGVMQNPCQTMVLDREADA